MENENENNFHKFVEAEKGTKVITDSTNWQLTIKLRLVKDALREFIAFVLKFTFSH